MFQQYVGVVDQGTKSTKFGVFDGEGTLLEQHSESLEQHYPQSGWTEYDPDEIWENTLSVVESTLSALDLGAEDLEAIGITNQRETTVVWDRETGEPVRNAISWQDRRHTDSIERRREEGLTGRIREVTGLELDPFYSAGKLEWILDHVDGLRDRARDGEVAFGTVDSWLLYNLTGEHATDVTNASRTMLFDIGEREWSDGLLEEFGVPRAMLPDVYASSHSEAYGQTDPDSPLGAAVPVTALIGDQHAALFGHTAFEEGEVKHTIGSSCVMQMNTGTEAIESSHGLATTIAYQIEGEQTRYALEGQIFTGGQAIEWLREIGVVDSIDEVEPLARSIDSTDGVYFVPAFQGLATPYWDPTARGTIVGLFRGTSSAQIVRATLEAIAYRTRDALDAMRNDSGLEIEALRLDGGMTQNGFLCQFLADLLATTIELPAETETTSLGAAYAAGLAAGVWPDLASLRESRTTSSLIEPKRSQTEMQGQYDDWHRAVERSLEWDRTTDSES